MSRTKRRTPHRYNVGGLYYEEAKKDHVPGHHPSHCWRNYGYDFRKRHVFHGRDGCLKTDIGYPYSDGPHCYSSWNEVWGMHRKRYAKFYTGRLRRLRSEHIIRAELRLEDDQC